MSKVTKGTLGFGVISPFQTQIWVTNVNPGLVWHFWCDNTTLTYSKAYVRITSVDTIRQANAHWVEIRVFNAGWVTSGFALRWSAVYD